MTDTTTNGRAQTFRSIFKTMPTASFALPELLEIASARIAGLNQGEAIVKIGIRPAAKIRTIRIREGWATPAHIARVKARIAANTPYIKPAQAIADDPPPAPKELPPPSNEPLIEKATPAAKAGARTGKPEDPE